MKRLLEKQTVKDVDLSGSRVLVRVDFNVPLDQGRVADDTRIRAALPTIKYLLEQDCSVILVSHLGRPRGQVVEELRLTGVARRLSELLGIPVLKTNEVTGPEVTTQAANLQAGQVMLLENVRFDPREETNDPAFARELANLAEWFVNDAFGVAHRAHASNVGVTQYLPAVAGKLVAAELQAIQRLKLDPPRPFWAVTGGAKVSDKLKVLKGLLGLCDGIIIGGGMANTFLAAQGINVGSSPVETDLFSTALAFLQEARSKGVKVILPVDVVAAEKFAVDAQHVTVPVDQIPENWLALDVGPDSMRVFREAMKGARTVFWNGPLGVFEWEPFAQGTVQMAHVLADLPDAWTVVAGGDSVAAVQQADLAHRISHISTGGGASLQLLVGDPMPGIEALLDREPGQAD